MSTNYDLKRKAICWLSDVEGAEIRGFDTTGVVLLLLGPRT